MSRHENTARAFARAAILAGTALTMAGMARAEAPRPTGPTPSSVTAPSPAAAQQQQQRRPNVLVWMLDDTGFAQLSSFGGLVATPNIDRVAKLGLRYTNYHTPPVCSAARASFLSGRMPHSVNLGGHAAVARPMPGYNARIPRSAGTLADNLRQAGYATFAIGKWDHLLAEESSPAGPFTQWPMGQGFDRFYGFLSADTDNWNPSLVSDTTPVARPDTPDYHLNRDMADRAIAMINTNRIADPARPFLLYWATSTAHAPHHAPADWIARYRGAFDKGWDDARDRILKAQKAKGIVPRHAALAPRPDGMPKWDSLSAKQKQLYTRQMEVFAGALSYADAQFGRILDALEASGDLDNTLVVILSDNGASAEGSANGMFSEGLLGRGQQATLEQNLPFLERWGQPGTYPHYSFGWAVAGNTPFRYFKHTTYEGGTRVPLVMAWPKGIAARGELRGQYTHVSDLAPTILEAAGVPLAPMVNNVEQSPMEGVSFAATFADAKAPSAKGAQYYEMFGNKGLWSGGWSIVTRHRLEPWDMMTDRPITAKWELYDLERDPGQSTDLAAHHPAKVAEMDRLFEEQAARYHVNPIGNIAEGMKETGRKVGEEFARRGGKWRYGGPVANIMGMAGPPLGAMDYTMSADLQLATGRESGPIFAAGGQMGGMALYLREGLPVFAINTLEGETTEVASREMLPSGSSNIALSLTGRRSPQGAAVRISAGGRTLAEGRIPPDVMKAFAIHELFGIGSDSGSAVLRGMPHDGTFPGGISNVEFDFSGRE